MWRIELNTPSDYTSQWASETYAQTAHWLSLEVWRERCEVEAGTTSILRPQPYILSSMKACSRAQQ